MRIGGTVYRAYQNLENTCRGTGTPAEVRQQVEAALSSLRERIASRVQGNGLTTPHLVHLERFRQQVAPANPHMTPAEVNRWVFPELLMVARHGEACAETLSLQVSRVGAARRVVRLFP